MYCHHGLVGPDSIMVVYMDPLTNEQTRSSRKSETKHEDSLRVLRLGAQYLSPPKKLTF